MLTFYLHIPKTAGQTLHRWLNLVYGPEHTLGWDPQSFGLPEIQRELATLLEERPDVQAVAGHFPYGVHEVLGDRPHRYVTFLRDPVDRWISERVHHITKNADVVLMERSFTKVFSNIDLFSLLKSTINHDEDINCQSKLVRQGCDRSDDEALARFWFVGRQESLSADCNRLAQLLGCEPIPLPESQNVAGFGDIRSVLAPEEIRWIEGRNTSDLGLCSKVPISACCATPAPAVDRGALVAAILQAALARMSECFLALKADREKAQLIMDHHAALIDQLRLYLA
ncbi:MAG: sulfotransferase family 2 domain-containing protein [Planctomycetia bacterium]|nr:sulfotransferase family 2 domain-containing protein [Planctomycetia bacterium]